MTSLSSSRVRVRPICLCLLLIVLPRFAAVAGAQVGGSLSGTIMDSTGGVIPGATVTLLNAGSGAERNTVTDARGRYAFPNVTVGRYDLPVTLEGFKPHKRTG